ncbi:MAG: HAD family hydrolase [Deltaproteobacteria bacterium]|nr:HAD family hydrolase [Deltaproteobacteria bacterium]
MNSPRRAALFDLDRTLVRVDTARLYVRYQRQIGEADFVDMLRVSWWALLYTFNMIDAPRVAVKALAQFKGTPEVVIAARCDDWYRKFVEPHVSDAARTTVRRHREAGDLCAIVTGASPYAARPLARALGIEHALATQLEVVDGAFTGMPIFPLCFGEGKVQLTRTLLDEHGIDMQDATFYSDSVTDLPLLSAVGTAVAVNPDPRLRRQATRRGWRIEKW